MAKVHPAMDPLHSILPFPRPLFMDRARLLTRTQQVGRLQSFYDHNCTFHCNVYDLCYSIESLYIYMYILCLGTQLHIFSYISDTYVSGRM